VQRYLAAIKARTLERKKSSSFMSARECLALFSHFRQLTDLGKKPSALQVQKLYGFLVSCQNQ
jgi:hypothetical protein